MIIVIDDERLHPTADVHLKTSIHALGYLTKLWVQRSTVVDSNPIDELWLDWDLGDGDTTEVVVKYIQLLAWYEAEMDIKTIVAHTQNPVGLKYINDSLSRYYKVVRKELISG